MALSSSSDVFRDKSINAGSGYPSAACAKPNYFELPFFYECPKFRLSNRQLVACFVRGTKQFVVVFCGLTLVPVHGRASKCGCFVRQPVCGDNCEVSWRLGRGYRLDSRRNICRVILVRLRCRSGLECLTHSRMHPRLHRGGCITHQP